MPPPDRVLNILRRAVDHTRRTPGRHGHLIHLQGCTELLVGGDMHGHLSNFLTVMKAADLGNHPTRHLVLQELIHSEFFYPNGGDKSHQLVDLYATLKCQFPDRVHFLPGNHEMAQMTGRQVAKGGRSQNALFVLGVQAAYGEAAAEICRAYHDLFRESPLAVRTANGVLCCHTIVPTKWLPAFDPMALTAEQYDEKEYAPGGSVYSILWGRDTSAEAAEAFLRKVESELVVTGHIATDAGFEVPNPRQLIVDCAGTPAAFVRFAADRPITHEELIAGVVVI
ncbi:MAG: metallophosphoesterase [Fimbriiglobus sp.]|nr:metallophosphoesterase [Fimbriiglobus sp.]